MKKTLIIQMLLLSGMPASSLALFDSRDKGTTAGQFLKLGAGARAIAMGEAQVAAAQDASALYWNPAGLTRSPGLSASLMHASLLNGLNYEYAALSHNLGSLGAWGLSAQHLSMPRIAETDPFGFETGSSFGPRDLALSLGYAHPRAAFLQDYSLGIAAKYVRSQIVESASTLAGDVGLLSPDYELGEARLRLAFAGQNLGGRLKFSQESGPLPVVLRAGAALAPSENWTLALDAAAPRDNRPHVSAGLEFKALRESALGLALRAGFDSRNLGEVDGPAGLAGGIGVAAGGLTLDYAFKPFGALGYTHWMSVSVRFLGNAEPAPPAGRDSRLSWVMY